MADELQEVCQSIKNWLNTNNKTTINVHQVIDNVFIDIPDDWSQRQLEIAVGKCLKKLGWKKVKKEYGNIWINY